MKASKGPGANDLRSEPIKWNRPSLSTYLLKLFKDCWPSRVTIRRFRVDAEVTSIYKGKEVRTDSANYRSIFILDTLGEFFVSMVCERLNLYEDQKADSEI